MRNTRIQLITGELEVLPNSMLLKNPVQVLTYRPLKRVEILAGVAYGEDVEQAVEVISQAVSSCDSVDQSHPVQVFPRGFGSSSIDIEVVWWTDPKPIEERRSRGQVVTAIKKALDQAGIEVTFPYRTLTFKEPLLLEGLEAGGQGEAQTGEKEPGHQPEG